MRSSHHLKPLLHRRSSLQVLGGSLDIVVDGLLGEIDHVAGEQRLAVQLVVALVLIQQTVQPGQQLLGAVVGVQDDGDAVDRGHAADVVRRGDPTGNRRLLAVVADALFCYFLFVELQRVRGTYLAGKVGGTAVGQLQDHRAVLVAGGLERGDDGGRGGDVLFC